MRILLNVIFCSLFLFCMSCGLSNAKTHPNPSKQDMQDAKITTKITAKFSENKILNPLNIQVSTHLGIVKLSGNVKNKNTFVEMLRLAKSVDGVKMVDTENLSIAEVNNVLTDAYITAKVEAAVLRAKVFDDESIPIVGINASTSNGTVTLSGIVKKNQSIAFIIKRVNAIAGVKKIISKLVVSSKDI